MTTAREISRVLASCQESGTKTYIYCTTYLHLTLPPAFETPHTLGQRSLLWTFTLQSCLSPQPPGNHKLFPQPEPWSPRFMAQLRHLLVVVFWASDLPSLAHFLICEPKAPASMGWLLGCKGKAGSLRKASGIGWSLNITRFGPESLP